MKKQFIHLALLSLAAVSFSSAATENRGKALASTGTLTCALADETKANVQEVMVQFDEGIPVASIDDSDHPADYTSSHIRIRLTSDGPVLTIGRTTGRAVLQDRSGTPMGSGRCESPQFI